MDLITLLLKDLPVEPVWVLAGLLAVFHASVFGLIFGPSLLKFPLLIIVAAAGVVAGQYAGQLAGLDIGIAGDLQAAAASVGAWLLLIIAKRLGA